MLTQQEIFDKACAGVIAQGRASRDDKGCLYAGPNNTACAIGQLLPREVAERWEAEGRFSIVRLLGCDFLSKPFKQQAIKDLSNAGVDYEENRDFLKALQLAHDRAGDDFLTGDDFLACFKYNAADLAKTYSLSADVLERRGA